MTTAYTETRFAAEAQKMARTLFENHGHVDLMGACVATLTPGTGEPLPEEMVMVLVPEATELNQEAKDQFASQVRILAKECGARMVATISESWYCRVPLDHPNPLEISPSQSTDRKEAVVISIETTAATVSHFADIEREEGVATLGEFSVGCTTPLSSVGGRFTRLLPCHHQN